MNTHSRSKTPKLPLTAEERSALRKQKLRIADISSHSPGLLAERLGITSERASLLIALAAFQSIPSIGPKLACDLAALGYRSLDELRHKNGASLFDELEAHFDVWIDPCVEDQLRCVVHHAHSPGSDRQWWDFTEERKAFRAQHGYPPTRPTTPWFA